MKHNSKGDYFRIPTDPMLEIIEALSDEEIGRLFHGMFYYMATGEDPALFGDEWFYWWMVKKVLDDADCSSHKGCLHWNWKGGITPENQVGRASSDYMNWRMSVFERDGFSCACCGSVGGKLNAHHIVPWSEDKSLRFDVNNGITLCEKCHKELHRRMKHGKEKND